MGLGTIYLLCFAGVVLFFISGDRGVCHDSGSSVNTITVWGVTSPDVTTVDNYITPVMTAGAQ